MCAIGSGVAPFLGMIRHKLIQVKNSDASTHTFKRMRLVYGYRHKVTDAIESDFLAEMVEKQILNELDCIESHNTSPKYYVQHYLGDNGHVVENEILAEDAVFYACGLADKEAADVQGCYCCDQGEDQGVL